MARKMRSGALALRISVPICRSRCRQEARACAPPHRGDQQADADGQAQHQVGREVVAIDKAASGHAATGGRQRQAAVDGLPQTAQHQHVGECLESLP